MAVFPGLLRGSLTRRHATGESEAQPGFFVSILLPATVVQQSLCFKIHCNMDCMHSMKKLIPNQRFKLISLAVFERKTKKNPERQVRGKCLPILFFAFSLIKEQQERKGL